MERAIEFTAAAIFAICVGWSLHALGFPPAGVAGPTVAGGVVALALLRHVGASESGPGFALIEPEFEEPVDDALLLEDELMEPSANSQVVRLFAVGGGYAAQAPGELAARIDRFLDGDRPPLRAVPAQPDATQELVEALAEIRRTLR